MARVQNLDRLKAKLTRLRKATEDDARIGLSEAADIIVAEQKRLAPVRTGKLRDSIDWKLALGSRTGNIAVRIAASAPHAHLIEFGTKAHTIEPASAEALQIGSDTFAEVVEHPGAAASPFFFPGYRSSRRAARARINKAIRDGVKRAVK